MNSGVRYHYDQTTETLDQVYETALNQPQLVEQCLGAKELRSCLSEQAAKLEKAKETENQPNASFFAASHMIQASECADRLKTCVTHQASENEDQ
jgi:hypothetical protein